jgi:FixJ family two-component response regulator
MECTDATVSLIDDDVDVREAVGRLLRSAGWKTELFASAQEYLTSPDFNGFGCILLDVSMPGMSGPELHNWMRQHAVSVPVIYLSGRCDVPISVLAMKRGALDVLQKPVDADILLPAIADAVEWHRRQCQRSEARQEIADRLSMLSTREREVMDHVIVGRLNKQIAADLDIAEKTVKVHRGRVMAKMRVRSVAELVRLCDRMAVEQ